MTSLRGIAQASECSLTRMLLAYWRKLLVNLTRSFSCNVGVRPTKLSSSDIKRAVMCALSPIASLTERRVWGFHIMKCPLSAQKFH